VWSIWEISGFYSVLSIVILNGSRTVRQPGISPEVSLSIRFPAYYFMHSKEEAFRFQSSLLSKKILVQRSSIFCVSTLSLNREHKALLELFLLCRETLLSLLDLNSLFIIKRVFPRLKRMRVVMVVVVMMFFQRCKGTIRRSSGRHRDALWLKCIGD